ncbi:hypothetical protein EI983_00795 [Roseovarius faecimaris]|uniref:DUF4034 domain-containing protein n=1 Tax=Roseovarius faecimaris TaxID=2494550 RepID=A0A6I6IJV3_9RHOB|nr:hypothetical protein [Roseovarius faecimaris]QGX96895.1 hypothetical protein EI983_00795 [Roseovarius faecimaris]
MRLLLKLSALAISTLTPLEARACWEAPTPECFTAKANEMTLAYHAEGPALARLHDLIAWDMLPSDAAAARIMLNGLTYEDLIAYHAADDPGAPDDDSFERALLLTLGLVDPGAVEPVPGEDLLAIYSLALQTEDPVLAARWYDHLPDYLAATSGLPAPDGADAKPADPYAEAQAEAISALTHLREGRIEASVERATGLSGEAGFLIWRALARHAIDTEDMTLLTRAVAGMQTALTPPEEQPFDEETFALALEAAEREFARTGDPDAMAHVYEMFDTHTAALPTGAALTAALARRYLMRETGQTGEDGFDAALADMARAMRTGEDEDDATPMRNARTALRLGLEAEADALIEMVFATYPGVPRLFLSDLPGASAPWANAWLDRMLIRYDTITADPSAFEARPYWSLWSDQDALDGAIAITRRLALYGRHDEAREFAHRALGHIARVTGGAMLPDGISQSATFEAETAPVLLAPQDAVTRMQALGYDAVRMAYALADAGQYLPALALIREVDGVRPLGHWINEVTRVPDPMKHDYLQLLSRLIEEEITRLAAAARPDLGQELRVLAVSFHAGQGDMATARRYFEQIESTGTTPAIYYQLAALRGTARTLDPALRPVAYPYDDFAL